MAALGLRPWTSPRLASAPVSHDRKSIAAEKRGCAYAESDGGNRQIFIRSFA